MSNRGRLLLPRAVLPYSDEMMGNHLILPEQSS